MNGVAAGFSARFSQDAREWLSYPSLLRKKCASIAALAQLTEPNSLNPVLEVCYALGQVSPEAGSAKLRLPVLKTSQFMAILIQVLDPRQSVCEHPEWMVSGAGIISEVQVVMECLQLECWGRLDALPKGH